VRGLENELECFGEVLVFGLEFDCTRYEVCILSSFVVGCVFRWSGIGSGLEWISPHCNMSKLLGVAFYCYV
jgi:hypothetical protein